MNGCGSNIILKVKSIRHHSRVSVSFYLSLYELVLYVWILFNMCVSVQVRLNQLMKQQERLLRESEATVERRETIVLRREAMVHSSHKQTTKGELDRLIQGLQRKIQDTHKVGDMNFLYLHLCLKHIVFDAVCMYVCRQHVVEREQVIKELQRSQVSLSDRLAQQRQQLIELCSTSYILDPDFVNLQDTKDRVKSTHCTVHCITTH